MLSYRAQKVQQKCVDVRSMMQRKSDDNLLVAVIYNQQLNLSVQHYSVAYPTITLALGESSDKIVRRTVSVTTD